MTATTSMTARELAIAELHRGPAQPSYHGTSPGRIDMGVLSQLVHAGLAERICAHGPCHCPGNHLYQLTNRARAEVTG